MKTMLGKSLGLAVLGLALFAGNGMALTIGQGTPVGVVDGNGDADVTVTATFGNTLGFPDYGIAINVNGGGWQTIVPPNFGGFTFSGGDVFDLRIINQNNSNTYSLTGDAANSGYSVRMDYTGIIPAAHSQQPVVLSDYFSNLTISWDLDPNVIGYDVFTIGFSASNSTDGFAPAPVPEPGTLLLLGSGLVGLAYLKRRKKA